jgi:lysine 2,3-aminomutase
MQLWQKSLAASIVSPEELSTRFVFDVAKLVQVTKCYPMRISPYYLSLVQHVGDPIWRQCVPDVLELEDDSQLNDPLCEEHQSPVPGLIHRYPDRVVWLVSSACAVYCRFCMRKRLVGCKGKDDPLTRYGDDVLEYIAANTEIRDVILSGGDPLLLEDDQLEYLLDRLRRIDHVEIIRIGTRVPVTLPQRITQRLCRILKKYNPLFLNTHFNHPLEITADSAFACTRLADAGIVLGNQSVLLADVNDSLPIMKSLMHKLLKIRVKPYYIHQMDLVKGTYHFRTEIRNGLEIMAGLRGHTSGMATPYYMIDLPGGKGKVPLLPDSCSNNGRKWTFTNYYGEKVEYWDAPIVPREKTQ